MSRPPIVPISQFRLGSDLVFTAGQIGTEPDGSVPPDFERQAELALDALAARLEEAGASLASVLKANVFIARRADFEALNRIYSTRFSQPWPARTTVVTELALPELLFEVEVIARRVHGDP